MVETSNPIKTARVSLVFLIRKMSLKAEAKQNLERWSTKPKSMPKSQG